MKIKEVGFFAAVIFFRCVAALLIGYAILSLVGIIFVLGSLPPAAVGQMFAKAILSYAVAGVGAWLAAKPIARMIVSDLYSSSDEKSDGKHDVLRESLREH